MLVKEIMKRYVAACVPGADLSAVIDLMRQQNCGFVPVVGGGGEVVGVITDRDACLSACSTNRPLARVSARETMSSPVFSGFADEDVWVALNRMARHHVRRLPVITRTGHLEGVISIDDIVDVAGQTGAPAAADVVMALRAINAHQRIQLTQA